MLRCLLTALFLNLATCLQAQFPHLKHFTAAAGLPSNTINDMLQDDDGFMWFATDEGVSRFDGHRFTNYRKADGLADDDVIRLGKDHEGRIWFLGFNGKASYFSDGLFYNEGNSKIAAKTQLGSPLVKFMISKNGTVYLVSNSDGYIRVQGDSVKSFSKQILLHETGARFASGIYSTKMDTAGSIWIFSLDSVYIIKESATKANAFPRQKFRANLIEGFFLSDGSVVIPRGGKLFRYYGTRVDSSEKLTASWHGQYESVEEDHQNNLWLMTNAGAHLFRNKQLDEAHHTKLLDAVYCGHVYSDREGNTWMSPLRQGVYLIPSLDIQFLHTGNGLINNNITTLAMHPQGVIAGFSNGAVQVIQHRNGTLSLQPSLIFGSYILDILLSPKNEFLVCTNEEAIGCNAQLQELWRSPSVWAKSYLQAGRDSLLVGGGFLLSLLSRNKTDLLYRFDRENRIYALEQEQDKTVWLGTEEGLYCFRDSFIQFYGERFHLLKGKINDLALDQQQRLWIASSQNGILLLQDTSLLQIIKQEDRISGRKICIADDQVVYAGTDQGIFIIQEQQPADFRIQRIRKSDGLPSEKINTLLVKEQLIWIGTDEGLEIFPLMRSVKAAAAIPVKLTEFTVNGISYRAGAVQHFDYWQNNMHLSFAGISFRQAAAVSYRYRIKPEDTTWKYTTNSSLDLPEMAPGRYEIIVQAGTSGTNWSTEPIKLSFTIHSPWWQSPWFYMAVILSAGAGILLLSRYRYKLKLQKEEQKRKAVEAELAALRSQMNPHFIFNSLNAIQDFIFQHKTEEANEYLTKFARMMRAILNQSRKQFVSIEEEADLLRMYLELESLRFNQAFSWTLEVDTNLITSEMMIPSMILQPVVENSIKHGFRNLQRKGILSVSFSVSDGMICCEVQDNGCGRKPESESNVNSHALLITNERLEIFNQSMQQPCTMQVIDLFETGVPAGLKTVFRFPVTAG